MKTRGEIEGPDALSIRENPEPGWAKKESL